MNDRSKSGWEGASKEYRTEYTGKNGKVWLICALFSVAAAAPYLWAHVRL